MLWPGTGAVARVFFLRRQPRHFTLKASALALHTHTPPRKRPREDNARGPPRPIHCASRLSTGVLASSPPPVPPPTSPPSPLLFRERVARCSVVAAGVVALCLRSLALPTNPSTSALPRTSMRRTSCSAALMAIPSSSSLPRTKMTSRQRQVRPCFRLRAHIYII